MSDEHNEQILWFTRRIVSLEAELQKIGEVRDRVVSDARNWRDIANVLADQLRAIARGERVDHFVARVDPMPMDPRERSDDFMLPLEQYKRQRYRSTASFDQPQSWP